MILFCFSDVDEIVRQSQAKEVDGIAIGQECVDVGNVKPKCKHQFKEVSEDKQIEDVSRKKFAPESRRKIKWVLNMFNEWRVNRMNSIGVCDEIIECNLDNVKDLNE